VGGQRPDPARGEGDRGVRRPALGGPVLRAARRLSARGGVQDCPPAPALPAPAARTEDRGVLARRRGSSPGAPAGLGKPRTSPAPRLAGRRPPATVTEPCSPDCRATPRAAPGGSTPRP